MALESADEATIKTLAKENRILRKKLERAEAANLQLEDTNCKKETLLRRVIQELQASQSTLEEQRQELEQMLLSLNQAQAQLIHTEKMSSLGQLVAGIAHEINNPVNFIHGNLTHVQHYTNDLLSYVQLYQQHYPDAIAEIQTAATEMDLEFVRADLPKVLDSMRGGTDRIRQIVLSLRNFSRMDEADCKAVDIHEGIESTLLILQHRLQEESEDAAIRVSRDYGELPLVECYAGQLNQVFMNILANAIDALEEAHTEPNESRRSQPPSQITIRTAVMDQDWIEVAIANNGPSIPADAIEKIFDPFFTTKPIGKGTGMGMSISHQIITEKHQGKLECSSLPGQGTEFVIRIPIQQLGEN